MWLLLHYIQAHGNQVSTVQTDSSFLLITKHLPEFWLSVPNAFSATAAYHKKYNSNAFLIVTTSIKNIYAKNNLKKFYILLF